MYIRFFFLILLFVSVYLSIQLMITDPGPPVLLSFCCVNLDNISIKKKFNIEGTINLIINDC